MKIAFTKRSGFIALGAVLVITAFVLVLGTALAMTAFLGRSVIAGGYYKEVSRGLAESCVQKTLLRLAGNSGYAGSEVVTVRPGETCEVVSVIASGEERIIRTRATFQNTYSHIEATVNVETLAIEGWEEPKEFSGE